MDDETNGNTTTTIGTVDRRVVALGINLIVSFITWNRRHCILNKRVLPLHTHQLYAFMYILFAGILRWISIISVDEQLLLQLSAGVVSTIMSWYGLMIIINGRTGPVHSRQVVALLYYIITDASYQIQTRLILNEK